MPISRMRIGYFHYRLHHPISLRLKALMRDRNAPQKQIWWAEIILFSADDSAPTRSLGVQASFETGAFVLEEMPHRVVADPHPVLGQLRE